MGCFGINDSCLLWIALICIVLILLGDSGCGCGCGCNDAATRTTCCN